MKYIELFKDTDEIVTGVLTGDVLPEVTTESETYFAEVVNYPDEVVVHGQVYDSTAKSILDTQVSINTKSWNYLMSTDWYAIREFETGTSIPADVRTKRQEARDAIVGVV